MSWKVLNHHFYFYLLLLLLFPQAAGRHCLAWQCCVHGPCKWHHMTLCRSSYVMYYIHLNTVLLKLYGCHNVVLCFGDMLSRIFAQMTLRLWWHKTSSNLQSCCIASDSTQSCAWLRHCSGNNKDDSSHADYSSSLYIVHVDLPVSICCLSWP